MSELLPALAGYCLALTGDRHDAEDVQAEGAVRAVTAIDAGRFDAGSADDVRRYLYRTLRNAAIDRTRRGATRRDHAEVVARQRPGTPPPSPDEIAERSEEGELVRRCLRELPPDQREVVVLRELEGLTLSQVAEVVGCSVTAAHDRHHRGLEHLRRLLEPHRHRWAGLTIPPHEADMTHTPLPDLLRRAFAPLPDRPAPCWEVDDAADPLAPLPPTGTAGPFAVRRPSGELGVAVDVTEQPDGSLRARARAERRLAGRRVVVALADPTGGSVRRTLTLSASDPPDGEVEFGPLAELRLALNGLDGGVVALVVVVRD